MGSSFLAAATTATPSVVAVSYLRLTIPAAPAATWLLALSDQDPMGEVLPGMLGERDDERLWQGVSAGRITQEDIQRGFHSAITQASGYKWWEAMKLVGMCDTSPEFVGRLTLKGIDPDRMPFARWCSAVVALALHGADDKERMKFEAKFQAPPAGYEEEAEGMSFDSMVAMARGMPGMRVG